MPKFLSLHERAQEFKSDGFFIFDERNQIMMCKYCDSRVDWHRKETCKKHLHSDSHKKKKDYHLKNNATPKQLSIVSSIDKGQTLKQNKQEFIVDFTNMLLETNIPIEKADNKCLQNWLHKYVPGSGDIPSAQVLRETYVPKIIGELSLQIKQAVANQKIVIMSDETTNRMGCCVFIVLIRILADIGTQRIFVGAVKELENANGTKCSRAILSVVAQHEIKYENVVAVVSDSARYMTKCMDSLRVIFSDGMVHVQCWAHKLNIIASLWSTSLPELNVCVQNAEHAFLNARIKKHRYTSFLKTKYPGGEKKATLFPLPVMTRWNSWFHSVEYIAEYLEDLIEFFKQIDDGGSAAEYFSNMSIPMRDTVICFAQFLVEHCSTLIENIVELEGSHYLLSHKLYSMLADLENNFLLVSRGIFRGKTSAAIDQLPTQVKQCAVKEDLKSLGLKCLTKLQSLKDKDTAKCFFSAIDKLFGVQNIPTNTVNEKLFACTQHIPLMNTLTQTEFLQGYLSFQQQVAGILAEGHTIDVLKVLQGLRERHPTFVAQAVSVLWIPASNVDSERAFSAYGHIFSDLRTGLKASNVELMLAKYFGTNI